MLSRLLRACLHRRCLVRDGRHTAVCRWVQFPQMRGPSGGLVCIHEGSGTTCCGPGALGPRLVAQPPAALNLCCGWALMPQGRAKGEVEKPEAGGLLILDCSLTHQLGGAYLGHRSICLVSLCIRAMARARACSTIVVAHENNVWCRCCVQHVLLLLVSGHTLLATSAGCGWRVCHAVHLLQMLWLTDLAAAGLHQTQQQQQQQPVRQLCLCRSFRGGVVQQGCVCGRLHLRRWLSHCRAGCIECHRFALQR